MLSWKSSEIIRLGVVSLLRHPGRSVLTMLGILFGVTAVIATMSVVEGIGHRMQQEVLKMGATNIIVQAVKPEATAGDQQSGGVALTYGLTYADAERIHSNLDYADIVVPARKFRQMARYRTRSIRTVVIGTVPWYRTTYGVHVEPSGRWLTAMDLKRTANVCVLGADVAEVLFPRQAPVGETVRLGDQVYRVVGVAQPRGSAGGGTGGEGENFDQAVYIPLTAASRRVGEVLVDMSTGSRSMEICELHEITVKLRQPEHVRPAARIIKGLLAKYHDPDRKDWEVRVPLERLEALERTKWLFIVLGVSIAAISLLVGGIGIMNIMLASVTERTREIGIRRALGAKRRDIVSQFLVETVVLSTVGGAVGVPVGWALATVIPVALQKAAASLGIGGEAALAQFSETIVTPAAVLVALGASVVVGVASGVYPAYRAAGMDPIRALRHE